MLASIDAIRSAVDSHGVIVSHFTIVRAPSDSAATLALFSAIPNDDGTGGTEMVEFVDTVLKFDETGRLTFNLSPNQIRLKGVMGAVSEAISKFMGPSKNSPVRPIEENGIFRGVAVEFSLPIPDVQGATTGLANLEVGARFSLMLEGSGIVPSGRSKPASTTGLTCSPRGKRSSRR